MTTPDWVPVIRRAGALVTDSGGMTCHAAIVSRELGVPCVVGARRATDGAARRHDRHGRRRPGRRLRRRRDDGAPRAGPPVAARAARAKRRAEVAPETLATRVYVNLAMADQAEKVAALPVDGVGLLRAEFMLTEALGGTHPRQLLADGRERELVDRMSASLLRITPRVRAHDRSCTARSTSGATSSADSRAASSSSRSRRTR